MERHDKSLLFAGRQQLVVVSVGYGRFGVTWLMPSMLVVFFMACACASAWLGGCPQRTYEVLCDIRG